ncbi:MAG: response regulator, partial [Planctomycetes bacterium]|nr:response regulator [Planctomycetota bacterium]
MPETAPSLSILLVDDDARFRASTAKGLELAGHTTQLAEDAAAARQTLDSGTSFDLILLDVNMPGENGFSLLGALREEGLRTPVLFVTARGTL